MKKHSIGSKCVLLSIVLIAFIILTEVISKFSFYLANLIYPNTPFLIIDSYGVYWYITLHHIFQLIFSALIILILIKLSDKHEFDFYLRLPNNTNQAIKISLTFIMAWIIIQFGLGILLINFNGLDTTLNYPLNLQTVGGQYFFQIFLSGTSEELLYRSLLIGLLNYYLVKIELSMKYRIPLIYLFTLIPFIFGHIPYQLDPFIVYSPNLLQLLTVIIFGSFYTYLVLKFDSIIPSMIVHGLLNAVIISSGFVFSMI